MKTFIDMIEAGGTPSIGEFVTALSAEIPALGELEATPQDPGWHAEGNVFIHTGMVLDATYELLASRAAHITGSRRTALILGAAFHDISKPVTTREMQIQGVTRVAAPRHEMRGRSYLLPRMMGQGLPHALIESTLALVGYHVTPKFLVIKERQQGSYLRLARAADPELLYWLELADMIGRTCADQAQQIEYIEMFGLFAQEYRAWRRFGDDTARWRAQFSEQLQGLSPATRDVSYASFLADYCAGEVRYPEEGLARSYRYRDPFPEVVLAVGPSGAGKSTWIERHLPDHTLISLDEIRGEIGSRADQSQNGRVRQLAKERLRVGLRAKTKLVWDATNLRRDFRDAVANLARDYGALVTIVSFPRSEHEYLKRNRGREHALPPVVIRRQLNTMQWPELSEAHRWLEIGAQDQVLAYYGGLDEGLPYGLEASPETLRELQ